MKAKNPTPQIMVRFKGTGQTRVFNPGDTLEGIVEINPTSDIKCRAVEIKAGWHTEGRGTRADAYPYFNRRDDINMIGMMQPFVEQFSMIVPSQPWSFSGHYVSIVWSVEVKIDIAMGRDITHSESFVLQP